MFTPGQIVSSTSGAPEREVILVGTPVEIKMPAFMAACVNAKSAWVAWRDRAGTESFDLVENMVAWSTGETA